MTTATQSKSQDKEAIKKLILEEARLDLEFNEKGINYNAEEINRIRANVVEPRSYGREPVGFSFVLPHGITSNAKYNRWTPYSIVVENDKPILYNDKEPIGEIGFTYRTQQPVMEQNLSTGEKIRGILNTNQHGEVSIGYSAECSLKELSQDCLFCSINVREKDPDRPLLKNPHQVSEAYHLVRQAGLANHLRITGGFVPEYRELEYYLDVAEAIHANYETFKGVAVIRAPKDFSILEKYKEIGYSDISHNLEVWDKNLFTYICPGKGDWRHWVDSLEASVEIFGWGNVHSNFVGGLDTKRGFLEGVEYLTSKGIVAHFGPFRPQKGTDLEGHRSPEASFHWEILDKVTDLQVRYGFTTEQMYRGPGSGDHTGRVIRTKLGDFEGNFLDTYKYPAID